MDGWTQVFLDPAKQVLSQVGQFVVNVLLFLILLLLGWLISRFIRTVVTKALRAAKLDDISDQIELDSLLAKGGISYSLSELIGVMCYWLALLVTFVVAINAVGLTVTADLLNKIILYIPNVIVAIFVLLLGMFFSTVLGNIVRTATANAGVSQGGLLTNIVRTLITVFAVFMALEQLQIGVKVSEITLAIILGSIGLGCALAFGLGCKDVAGKFMNEIIEKVKK
jgi:hypothetical protein